MKTLLSFLIISLGILFSNDFSISKSKNLHGGRCTGSANCSACSNCSRCGHCSSGGTCGVCSGSSSGRNFYSYSPKTKKTNKKSPSYKFSDSENTKKSTSINQYSSEKNAITAYSPGIILFSKNEIVEVRKFPTLKAVILEKVKKNSKLILLKKEADWYKVEVQKTGTIGYVLGKAVKN